ncbi:hypothetical protein BDF20DRAFT_833749 [Mycotypha africana]|uniref:uncharacterized protein n=1 Tax=Mycotypha africana TaxID=64632 RepID=UPI002300DD90|nr:uncharacterized protein BDF20DRAFT_833749 [Mycotypha africana]KAI8984221.1 hypothetical protein BDF20DRAFT_833749 [Mycotypha africana]
MPRKQVSNDSKGVKPSEFKAKHNKAPLIDQIPSTSSASSSRSIDDIPDAEKLRLIDQTGLLQKVKKREAELAKEKGSPTEGKQQQIDEKTTELPTSTSEYIWQAIFLSIPFGFLVGTFDVTVKVQYSEPWTYMDLILKSIKSAPVLAPFIYLTNRYRASKSTQTLMFLASSLIGSLLMYTLRHSPSMGQMMRAPGLATVWIYFIVQLDLIPATVSLIVVAIYWYYGLRD